MNVGANVNISTSTLAIGNSSVNTTITSSSITTNGTISATGLANVGSVNVVGAANVGGALNVIGNAVVTGTANIAGNTTISGAFANVTGNMRVGGDFNVAGNIAFTSSVTGDLVGTTSSFLGNSSTRWAYLYVNVISASQSISTGGNVYSNVTTIFVGNSTVNSTMTVDTIRTGNATVNTTITGSGITTNGTLTVLGTTSLANTLGVTGATTLSNTSSHVGSATFSNTVSVTGAANLLSTVGISGAANLASTLGVVGATTLSNTIAVTGAATLSNTLNVTGLTTLTTANVTSGLNVSSNTSFNSNVIKDFVEDAAAFTNTGTAVTVSSSRNVQRFTLNGNATVTLPSSMPGKTDSIKSIVLIFKQDATGGRTMTLAAPSGEALVFNNSSTQPAVPTSANKMTIFICTKYDGDTNWYVSQSFIQP